jgi:hypothetical protein
MHGVNNIKLYMHGVNNIKLYMHGVNNIKLYMHGVDNIKFYPYCVGFYKTNAVSMLSLFKYGKLVAITVPIQLI